MGWLTETEQLEEDNAVTCTSCCKKVRALTNVSLAMLPPVLIVQLKRFQYESGKRHRLSTSVSIPLEGLDLSRFCSPSRVPTSLQPARSRLGMEQHNIGAAETLTSDDGALPYF